jgi:hypothetical protein
VQDRPATGAHRRVLIIDGDVSQPPNSPRERAAATQPPLNGQGR